MYRYRSLSTIQGRNVEKFRMRVSAVSEQRMGQVVGCSHRQTMANVSSDGSSIRSLGYAYNTPPNNITWRFVCECLAPQKSQSFRPDATFCTVSGYATAMDNRPSSSWGTYRFYSSSSQTSGKLIITSGLRIATHKNLIKVFTELASVIF